MYNSSSACFTLRQLLVFWRECWASYMLSALGSMASPQITSHLFQKDGYWSFCFTLLTTQLIIVNSISHIDIFLWSLLHYPKTIFFFSFISLKQLYWPKCKGIVLRIIPVSRKKATMNFDLKIDIKTNAVNF